MSFGAHAWLRRVTGWRARLALPAAAALAVALGPPAWASDPVPVAVNISPQLSCSRHGACESVGMDYAHSGDVLQSGEFFLSDRGGSWSGYEANKYGDFQALSCWSTGSCVALGDHWGVQTETNGVWGSQVPLPNPASGNVGAGDGGDAKLSCTSTGECTIVGVGVVNGTPRAIIWSETGGTWSVQTQALPGNYDTTNGSVAIDGLSCAATGSCTAVGYYDNTSHQREGMLLSEAGGVWAPATAAPVPAGAAADPKEQVLRVSCSSPGNCSAVGLYNPAGPNSGSQGMVLSETAGSWGPATAAPTPASALGMFPADIRCTSAGNCVAVGSWYPNVTCTTVCGSAGLILTQSSGSWTATDAPKPAGSYGADLYKVSCPQSGHCAATGTYDKSNGDFAPMLLDQGPAGWTETPAVLPGNAAGGQGGNLALDRLDCSAVGECAAAGTYLDSASTKRAMLFSETGGVWSRGVEVTATLPPSTPGGAGGSGSPSGGSGGGGSGGGLSTLSRPTVKITKQTINRKRRLAAFRFRSTGATTATGFQCALISQPKKSAKHAKVSKPHFTRCTSGRTYRHLKKGKYTFEVRALARSVIGPAAKRGFSI